jgi:hypothetical protein
MLVAAVLLTICVTVIFILTIYSFRVREYIPDKIVVYTHCAQKPLNRPMRNAFSKLGIKFISPDKIIYLAQQPRQKLQKIIYIPCSNNNSDLDIQQFFRGKKLLSYGKRVQWLTAAVLGCNKLCSKNGLWSVLETTYGRPDSRKITPESWVIPADVSTIRSLIYNPETHKKHPLALIFKKNIQGKQGLLLTNSPAEIRKLISAKAGHNNNNYCVAQRYIDQPYLIHGRKLNIRLYVLVVLSPVSGSSWWLYPSGKCIYTNRQYELLPPGTTIQSGSDEQISVLEQHFTSLNLDPQKVYQEEQCPETLDELHEYMLAREEDWHRIWETIQLGLQKVARAYTGKLTAYPNSVGYQIFGVDYILTRTDKDSGSNITPYLLEFNKGPEMKYKSPRDKELKQGLQHDILELVLGHKPGKWLLLNSVNKSKISKS